MKYDRLRHLLSLRGYIAFAFGLYAIIFMRSKILFFVLLVLTYLTILNPVLIPAGIRYRLSQTFVKPVSYTEMVSDPINAERSVDGSTSSRIEVWKGAIKMIKEKPFFGFGYGLFFPLIRYYWAGGTLNVVWADKRPENGRTKSFWT